MSFHFFYFHPLLLLDYFSACRQCPVSSAGAGEATEQIKMQNIANEYHCRYCLEKMPLVYSAVVIFFPLSLRSVLFSQKKIPSALHCGYDLSGIPTYTLESY